MIAAQFRYFVLISFDITLNLGPFEFNISTGVLPYNMAIMGVRKLYTWATRRQNVAGNKLENSGEIITTRKMTQTIIIVNTLPLWQYGK